MSQSRGHGQCHAAASAAAAAASVCDAQIMKTDFVPKLVASISAGCAVYAAVTVADRLLTVRTLASVSYFDALVSAAIYR